MALTYWQQLQLSFDPFMTEQANETAYLSPRFEQQLDLLTHLASSENKIQLVTGLTGIGKTTMMRLLVKELANSATICKVHGGATITPDVLQELLARHLNVHVDANQAVLYKQALQAKILTMQQKKQHFYMLIDNAHKLPKASLAFLLEIMTWQPEGANVIHVVLFGGPQLETTFSELTSTAMGEHKTHTIRLEPLNEEEVANYIKHRLTLAGWNKASPFSETEINKIMHASNGIPAKINYLAKQVLQKKVQLNASHRMKAKGYGKIIKISGVITAILLIAYLLLSVYYNYKPKLATSKQQKTLILHKEPVKTETVVEVQLTKSAKPEIKEIENTEIETEVVKTPKEDLSVTQEKITEITPIAETKPAPESATQAYPPTHVLAASLNTQSAFTQQQPNAALVEPEPAPQPAPQVKAVKPAPKPKAVKQTVAYRSDTQYILSRNKYHYALQLAGAHNKDNLKSHFAAIAMAGRVYYFQTTHNGKPWYVAIYGDYASEAQAKNAILSLPAIIQQSSPWPRSYGNIQQAITR